MKDLVEYVQPVEGTIEPKPDLALLARLNQRFRGARLVGFGGQSLLIRIDPAVPPGEVRVSKSEGALMGGTNIKRGRR